MLTIVIPDDAPTLFGNEAALENLRRMGTVHHYQTRPSSADDVVARCRDADVVVNVYSATEFTAGVLAQLPKLRMITRCGTGMEGIDLDACGQRGIAVTNLRGNDAEEIAEHSIALMLTVLRRIAEFDRNLRKGVWSTQSIGRAKGRTLGVVGLGAIGQRTARLGQALGMKVLAWTYGDDGGRAADCGAQWVELEELLGSADVVSLHLRLSEATCGLIDAHRFGLMKREAILINTARAALVDREALLNALSSERIAGAGLDVFHDEPLSSNDPLLEYSNVVMTPHCGGNIPVVMERAIAIAVMNIDNWVRGNPSTLAAGSNSSVE